MNKYLLAAILIVIAFGGGYARFKYDVWFVEYTTQDCWTPKKHCEKIAENMPYESIEQCVMELTR